MIMDLFINSNKQKLSLSLLNYVHQEFINNFISTSQHKLLRIINSLQTIFFAEL